MAGKRPRQPVPAGDGPGLLYVADLPPVRGGTATRLQVRQGRCG